MSLLPIETPDNPVLRKKARNVTVFDADLQNLIDDMIETMREASGVGLAGPQVNQSLRLTVVETLPENDDEGDAVEGSRELYVLINPEIVWKSRKMVEGMEGCLSIPGWVGEVSRHEGIRVRALDRNGKKIKLRLTDWSARIVQHEVDHLDGILYIDRLTDPDNFWTEEEFFAREDEADEEVIPLG
jgi:peptide deformylase